MKKEYSIIMENTKTIFFKETDKFAEKKPEIGEDGEVIEKKEEGEEAEPKKES